MEPAEVEKAGKKQIAQIIALIVATGITIKFIISLLGSIATKEELIRVYQNLPQDKVVKIVGLREHIKNDKDIHDAAEGLVRLQGRFEAIETAMAKGQLKQAKDITINANGLIADLEKKYGFLLTEEKNKLLQVRFELAEMIKKSQ